ncbi:hypothetical protein [Halomonas heilongjiangensis]|uniref:hypothetical protein n=1 Tax=Halomonas heilongjiangensis TaxID=1387883 RepID=UPI0011AFC789|nr:hypothetical protein [Halomonas heilongjiangensis]
MAKFAEFLSWGFNALADINEVSKSNEKKPARPKDPEWIIDIRRELERFFEEHENETIGDRRDEIRSLINYCNDKAYQNGGKDMFEGIKRNNPDISWE